MWIISDPEPISEMARRRTHKAMSRDGRARHGRWRYIASCMYDSNDTVRTSHSPWLSSIGNDLGLYIAVSRLELVRPATRTIDPGI
jgi:hypothetical protein